MNKTTNKLIVTLPSDVEIMMVREFDAPRTLVFEAMSTCEHLYRWWGPANTELHCKMDFRVGGSYHFILKRPDGSLHPFKGEFTEIEIPEKITQTFIYDVDFIRDLPALTSIVLTERDSRTVCTSIVRHVSKEARDGHLQNGMEEGAGESYDRLDALLAELHG